MDVAKVDQDVTYVEMVVHVRCKRLSQMFYLFFRCMLQLCLSGCCICFTHMLQVLSGCCVCLQWFSNVLQVFHTHVSSFICLLLYVVSVPSECFKNRSRYCTCNAREKQEEARAVPTHSLVARATSWATQARCWSTRSQVRRLLARCAGIVRASTPNQTSRH
jgi:hypothetical protein